MAKHKPITVPAWCVGESDYRKRERLRRRLVREIRRQALRFTITSIICAGCDQAVWEALLPGDICWKGCHCISLVVPESMKAHPFDAEHWAALTAASGLLLAIEQRRRAELN